MTHSSESFQSSYSTKLFQQSWIAKNEKAVVGLIHGLGEHSSRYERLAKILNHSGVTVHTFDLYGHGKSEGDRAYIKRFTHYVDDVDIFFQKYLENSKCPIFLLGHSMGGLITVNYILDKKPKLDGVLLSGSALMVNPDLSPLLQKISGFLSIILPKLKTVALEANDISTVSEEVQKYIDDPLVYHDGLKSRLAAEMLKTIKKTKRRFAEFDTPVLIMHGSDDRLADCRGSKDLFNQCTSKVKELKIYDGFYHEILNEADRGRVESDILNWLLARI